MWVGMLVSCVVACCLPYTCCYLSCPWALSSVSAPAMLQKCAYSRLQHQQISHLIHRVGRCSRAAARALPEDQQQIPAKAAQILESIRIVLVAPKTPANIGAVARCCANFEVTAQCTAKALLQPSVPTAIRSRALSPHACLFTSSDHGPCRCCTTM